MKNTISNLDDVIDSRDIINRIEELTEERDALVEAVEESFDDIEVKTAQDELNNWNASDEAEELKTLLNVQDQAEGYSSDWPHGTTLIRDSYFEEYMDEMLEDCGDLPENLPYYLTITVDYDALRQDYTSIDFDGVTYWIR